MAAINEIWGGIKVSAWRKEGGMVRKERKLWAFRVIEIETTKAMAHRRPVAS